MNALNPRALGVKGSKQILMGLVLAAGVMLTQPVMAAGPAPIVLGSCSNFAILAASAVSGNAGGHIDGDVGLIPTTGAAITILNSNQVNGTIYAIDNAGLAGSVDDPALLTR